MARQRVRAELTWKSAKAAHRSVERKLAQQACTGKEINTQEHWKNVGRYEQLNELLWECDK